jgi:hypothetical protein
MTRYVLITHIKRYMMEQQINLKMKTKPSPSSIYHAQDKSYVIITHEFRRAILRFKFVIRLELQYIVQIRI